MSSRIPHSFRRPSPTRLAATVACIAIAGAALSLLAPTEDAVASVPTGTPVFSNPTQIDHPYFPFEPGAVSVFAGKSDGERTSVVFLYLDTTRELNFGSGTVECVTLQETEFEDGEIAEISVNYFAQADDGTVYYFGETVDDYEDGEIVAHSGSWLVGGPSGDDPVETMTVTTPAVFFPGNPEVGDLFRPEDLPDGSFENVTIQKLEKRVRVPVGRHESIQVEENHFPGDTFEKKWYVPGLGFVKAKAKGEVLKMVASTFQAED